MRKKITFYLFPILCFGSTVVLANPKQSINCEIGSHWVSTHFRKAYVRADGTFVGATTVSGHCRQDPVGYALWYPRIKTSRPIPWGYRKEISKKWTAEEIERLLEAISELPELLREQALKGIHRMLRSVFPGNPATNNQGDVVLYDLAFSSKYNLARVIAHELAHQLYDSLSPEDKKAYRVKNGWNDSNSPGAPTSKRKAEEYVQADGKDSPDEDFANNVEYYVFEPGELKKRTPTAYQWIDERFGGKLKSPLGKDIK